MVATFSAALSAQTFAPIPALSFEKPFAGANPLPQTLTLASTGANFNVDVAASTSSGGNWLQVSPQGTNCCVTPESVTVLVNAPSSLAAGTYTGQIVFTAYGRSGVTLTVPVTLKIQPASSPFFDNLPGQMSFSFKVDGASPPIESMQIRNAGAGSLSWTATASTADGGNWLNVPVKAGTAPSTVSVGVDVAALPGAGKVAGNFTGLLHFQSATGAATVPVSVTVGQSVFEQINPIQFTKPYTGDNPLPQTLLIASTGSDFNFNVSAYTANGGNWLQVSPVGTNCCVTPESITITVNADAAIKAGTYTGQVVITEYAGNGMAMTVPVTLTVASPNQDFFDNLPGQLSFSLGTKQASVPAQPIQIRNAGAGALAWTASASTADGGQWLTVSPGAGNAPSTLSVSISKANLPYNGLVAGNFTGQVTLRTAGSATTIPVSVAVGDDVFEQVNAINFTQPFAGANPLPQTLTVSSTGSPFNFNVAAYTATGGDWLQVSPFGTNCCVTPESITVSVNPSEPLEAGTYTGQIVFTQYAGHGMAMTVPVTLTVSSSGPSFDSLPGHLSFFFKTGGNAPPNQPLQIRNAGSGSLAWSLTSSTADGGNWLTESAASGTAPNGISIGINKAALPNGGSVAGTFNGQIALHSASETVTIPVTVVIGETVFEQVNALNFTMPYAGGNPLPQTITIPSTGTNFNFNVAAFSATGGDWLQVSPAGVNCCVTPESLTVSVNPSDPLEPGTYTGQVVITEYSGHGMAMTVPVTLTVAPPNRAFFDNVQGQLSFSFQPNGAIPPAQNIRIRNAGSGSLAWTASASTADGAKWLTLSSASGTAPFALSVGILKSALPGDGQVPGIFTGQVVLRAAGDIVTVPVSVVIGASVFDQIAPLTFTKAPGGSNPPAQSVTIASTQANFNVSVAAFTAQGGDWLLVTPYGTNCCVTPESISVSVNPAATLPAGVYTGEVVVTQYSGHGMAMTIPIYLNIGSGLSQTATSVLSSLNPSGAGQAVTFTANVSGSGSGISGNVTFRDGAAVLATTSLVNRAASFTTSSLAAGTHSITASYSGNSSNSASTSPTFVQTVQSSGPAGVATATALTSSLRPSIAGQSLTFVAKVSASGKAVPGSVTFKNGSVSLTTATLVNGSASYTTTLLPSGSHSITAIYSGGNGYAASTSSPVAQQVLLATATVLTSSANPSASGQFVSFTATVNVPATGLNGYVTFFSGTIPLSTVPLNGRTATLVTSRLVTGPHSLSAFYSGNAVYAGSLSAALSQIVK